jgi:hypothetical protein
VQKEDTLWVSDIDVAAEEAARRGRPLMIFFERPGDSACQGFEQELFSRKTLGSYARRVVPVKLDIGGNAALARKLKARIAPTVVFASPELKVLERVAGFVDTGRMRRTLNAVVQRYGPDRLTALLSRANDTADMGDYAGAYRLAQEAERFAPTPALKAGPRNIRDQIDRKAEGLLELAADYETEQQWYLAVVVYERLQNDFASLPQDKKADDAISRLMSNEDASSAIEKRRIDEAEATSMLEEAYIAAGRKQADASRRLLVKLIEIWPGTVTAAVARRRLKALDPASQPPEAQASP